MGSSKARSWDELELLEGCNTVEAFAAKYENKFGKATDLGSAIAQNKRITSMWYLRKKFLAKLAVKKAEDAKRNRTVMIPAVIVRKGESSGKPAAFADDEIMVKIHNLLAELVQLQKEQVAIFSKLSEKKNDGKATPPRT